MKTEPPEDQARGLGPPAASFPHSGHRVSSGPASPNTLGALLPVPPQEMLSPSSELLPSLSEMTTSFYLLIVQALDKFSHIRT